MIQADISLNFFWVKAAFVGDVLAGGEQLEDSGGTYDSHLEGVEAVSNHSDGTKEQLQIHDKRDQNTDLQVHAQHAHSAIPNH